MLSQTPDQVRSLSEQIPELMSTLVRENIECNMAKYGRTFEEKLGLMEDDILNDVREQIWKGLITYRPKRANRASLRTYLYRLIDNRFKLLARRSTRKKFNSVTYCANINKMLSYAEVDTYTTEETGETILAARQEFVKDMAYLGYTERLVFAGLAQGYSIVELMEVTRLTRAEVIKIVNQIDCLLKIRRDKG